MLNVAGIAVDVLSQGLGTDCFFELLLTILQSCLGRVGFKNFVGESCWLGEKKEKDLLNCRYKATFQLDECTEPTAQWRVLFILVSTIV